MFDFAGVGELFQIKKRYARNWETFRINHAGASVSFRWKSLLLF